jgi:hypothetical protein
MTETTNAAGDERKPPRTVAPLLPLALLESIRAHDRPREVLEDEDLATSLPRRLGLTGVVDAQIRHYEEARRRRRDVAIGPVADLLRLVLRRPDAADILREAGYGVARRHFSGVAPPLAAAARIMPQRLRMRVLRRSTGGMMRRVIGAGEVELVPPLLVRATRGLAATTDPGGTACGLYEGALEELVFLYTCKRPRVRHERCVRNGSATCEWELTP